MAPASLGQRVTMAILATIPPALIGAGIYFGFHYWSVHSGAPFEQRALLTTDPVNARGSLEINGTVVWRAVNNDNGMAIRADLTVPFEGTHIVLTFSKNTDPSLPASHIIEVALAEMPGSRAGPVAKVGNLVGKPAPDAEGTPLAATVVDVNKTRFWIAFSQLAVDRSANLRLLAASPFFALPITYASGKGAVITFEKGHTGEPVFRQVLTAWGP